MNIDSMFPSKFFKASDLDNGPVVLRIAGVEAEKMNDGEAKPVLYFSNADKTLILNKTNAGVLRELYGSDTAGWEGKPIRLIAATTDYQGRVVDCIRLRPPANKTAAKPTIDQDLDGDSIPF